MKKIITILFLMVLSFTLIGCGKEDQGLTFPDYPNTPDDGVNSWNHDNSEFDFTWYVNLSYFNWNTNGTDLVSRIIKEKTGANIKIVTPVTDDGQMLSTMIAGGKLPDVISVQSWYPQVTQLANQGYVYPLDDLIDRWAPSMKTRIQQDVWDWFKEGDGKTYGIPNFAYSNQYVSPDEKMAPNGGILVREDWYYEVEANGIDMTTPEGFIAGAKYIKNKYGDSVIPIQLDNFDNQGNQSINWLSQYFSVPFEDVNGNFQFNFQQPRYLEMLQFLNQCYKEGLIRDSNFSANNSQVNTALASGNVFVSMVTPQDFSQAFVSDYNRGVTYIPLVLRNKDKEAPVLQDLRGMGFLLSMITTNATRPDKIIKVFDFLYSEEGQRLVAFGVEGNTWNWTDETHTKVEWTQKYLDDLNNNAVGQYGLYSMNLLMNLAYINKIKPSNGKTAEDIYLSNLKKPLSPYSYDYTPYFLKHDPEDPDYFNIMNKYTRIQSTYAEWLPDIIRAENPDTTYNQAMADIERRDLASVKTFFEKSYERAKEVVNVDYGWPKHQPGYTDPVTGPNGDFSFWEDATYVRPQS